MLTFYILCRDEETAKGFALLMFRGFIRNLYDSETAIHLAHSRYPPPLYSRYFPFRVTINAGIITSIEKLTKGSANEEKDEIINRAF